MPGAGHVSSPPGPAASPRWPPVPGRPLLGCKVLLVEDQYLIACDTAKLLHEAGAEVVGPVGRLAQARELAAREPHLDGAVLDVQLGDGSVCPLVPELAARGVPVLLATGYGPDVLPEALIGLPHLVKPFGRELGRVAAEAFGRAGATDPA